MDEGDEVNEQLYVVNKVDHSLSAAQKFASQQDNTGSKYCIGFTDGKNRFFHVKLGQKTIVGGYEVVTLRKSEFVYKALDKIHAFSIRKRNIKPILDEYPLF